MSKLLSLILLISFFTIFSLLNRNDEVIISLYENDVNNQDTNTNLIYVHELNKKIEDYIILLKQTSMKLESNKNSFMFLYDDNIPYIQKDYINKGNSRSGQKRDIIKYIVIHDTGNYSKNANALAHSAYLKTDPGNSWHYTVDSNNIINHIPDDEIAYHAGDGLRRAGTIYYNSIYKVNCITGGNYNGIGIETCVNDLENYYLTLINTSLLVYELLEKYDLNISDIKMHKDFSGKDCPYVIIKSNIWHNFINMIRLIDYRKTVLNDCEIEYVDLNNITNNGLYTEEFNLKLKVKYNGNTYYYDI